MMEFLRELFFGASKTVEIFTSGFSGELPRELEGAFRSNNHYEKAKYYPAFSTLLLAVGNVATDDEFKKIMLHIEKEAPTMYKEILSHVLSDVFYRDSTRFLASVILLGFKIEEGCS